jgi:hypothetical protein
VVAATVGSAVLIMGAPSAAPLPTAPLPRPLDTTTVPAADAGTTTITLEVTPASPADPTSTETLTATIAPSTAAGVVQFNDGNTTLSDPVTLTNGTATITTTLPAGDDLLTADFTPTNPADFGPSASAPVSLTEPALPVPQRGPNR